MPLRPIWPSCLSCDGITSNTDYIIIIIIYSFLKCTIIHPYRAVKDAVQEIIEAHLKNKV